MHVSGAVARPGLVEVPRTARVADAVAAAGGATAEAELAAINLADALHDTQQIVVPNSQASAGHPVADGVIHLNRATTEELESIPGVGPVLAGRIIAARELLGGFSAVEDLLDVSGIGEARLATFRDLVAVP